MCFTSQKTINVEIKMDKDGNIDDVINKETKKEGDYKRYKYQDDEFEFQFSDQKTAKQVRQEKKKIKRLNKKTRSFDKDEAADKKDITLDINAEGDYRLRTKNMKKIMNQKFQKASPKKDGVKEAKILREQGIQSSDGEEDFGDSHYAFSQEKEQEAPKFQSKKKEQTPHDIFDYKSIISKSKRGSWKDQLDITNIINQCDTELQKVTTFLHSQPLKQLMLQFYRVLEHVITSQRIDEFIQETQKDKAYMDYILEWKNMRNVKKVQMMEEQGWLNPGQSDKDTTGGQTAFSITRLPTRQLILIKPYVELLTDYLQKNCQEELKTSQELSEIADIQNPWDWFPETREKYKERQFHYHLGPTNSGKTRSALNVLRKAQTGLYLAPLRLLAMQIHDQLSQGYQDKNTGFWVDGIVCNLKTGPSRKVFKGATHTSSTIEMCNINDEYDVAVIDEVQMIEDQRRGHNWTNAILGLKAKEIHVCGDERSLKILEYLLENTGDKLLVHEYRRLSKLSVDEQAFQDYDQLEEGDCFIGFNKKQLHQLKDSINNHMNTNEYGDIKSNENHVSIIYGALPPESKLMQQQNFNERKGKTKFMVATDAIGMGMNLNIKRIIFSTLSRPFQRSKNQQIDSISIRQIAGRAGRFTNEGRVSTFYPGDLKIVRRQLLGVQDQSQSKNVKSSNDTDSQPNLIRSYDISKKPQQSIQDQYSQIKRAVLFPPFPQIQEYSKKLERCVGHEVSYSDMLLSFKKTTVVQGKFKMKHVDEELMISDSIQDIPFLSLKERFNFSKAPLHMRTSMTFNYNQKRTGNYFKDEMVKYSKKSTIKIFSEFVSQFAAGRTQEYYDKFLDLESKFQKEEGSESTSEFYRQYADQLLVNEVPLPEFYKISDPLFNKPKYTESDIIILEDVNNILDCYLWLTNPYPNSFLEVESALVIKDRCCEIMDAILLNQGIVKSYQPIDQQVETIIDYN